MPYKNALKQKEYFKNYDAKRSPRKEYKIRYYLEHKEQKKIYNKIYRENEEHRKIKNIKEQIRYLRDGDRLRLRQKNRYNFDIQFKLSQRLRLRLVRALKGNYRNGSAIRDLGCSIEELRTYLEKKFQPKMTWKNWSKKGWHIDHIIPISLFDLTDRKQLLQACHYTNLQPLWAIENHKKGNKIN